MWKKAFTGEHGIERLARNPNDFLYLEHDFDYICISADYSGWSKIKKIPFLDNKINEFITELNGVGMSVSIDRYKAVHKNSGTGLGWSLAAGSIAIVEGHITKGSNDPASLKLFCENKTTVAKVSIGTLLGKSTYLDMEADEVGFGTGDASLAVDFSRLRPSWEKVFESKIIFLGENRPPSSIR